MSTPPGPRHGPPRERQNAPPQRQPEQVPDRRPRAVPPPPPPGRDPGAVRALRITTYVLTSLASLLFIALVIYGYVAVQDLKDRLSSNPLFGGGLPSTSSYGVPSQQQLCATNPDAPECAAGLN